MKRIAFYLHHGIYGGGERVLLTLMDEFYKKGYNVIIYSSNRNICRDNIKYPIYIFTGHKILQIIRIIKNLLINKVDCIIMFGTMTQYFVASQFARVKFIFSLRIDPSQIKQDKILVKWLLLKCNKCVFQTKKILQNFSSNIQKKSCVIYNPILDDLPNIVQNRKRKIAMVGRMVPDKNQEMGIRAFAQIDKKGYTLHIFGQGPLESYIKELTKELKIEDSVVFEGQVTKVVDKIKDFDIMILPSDFEGMPNALIEGMAMGLACITTDFPSGAAKELIINDYNGIIVQCKDVDSMAKQLERIISDEILKKKLQINAPSIRNLLNKEKIINQWIELIEKK